MVQGDAVYDKRLTEIHLRVLLVLGHHTDRRGWCWLNQTHVAKKLGYSRESINRALRDLVDWGRVYKERGKGKDHRKMFYLVVMDRTQPDEATSNAPKPEPENKATVTHGSRDEGVTRDARVTVSEKSCEIQTSQPAVTSGDHTPVPLKGNLERPPQNDPRFCANEVCADASPENGQDSSPEPDKPKPKKSRYTESFNQ
ncbi:MAG: helix-turn-helix domain-containing protein, partial [Dichotomicrobium sp.]